MDDVQIVENIAMVLEENFHVKKDEVNLDASLVDDLGLDSVDIMDSIYFLEDKFGTKLLDEGPEARFDVKTIGDVVAHIKERLNS